MKYVSNTTKGPIVYKDKVIPPGASVMLNNKGEIVDEVTDNTEELEKIKGQLSKAVTLAQVDEKVNDLEKKLVTTKDKSSTEMKLLETIQLKSSLIDNEKGPGGVYHISTESVSCTYTAERNGYLIIRRRPGFDLNWTGSCDPNTGCEKYAAWNLAKVTVEGDDKVYRLEKVTKCVQAACVGVSYDRSNRKLNPYCYCYHEYGGDDLSKCAAYEIYRADSSSFVEESITQICVPLAEGKKATFCAKVITNPYSSSGMTFDVYFV